MKQKNLLTTFFFVLLFCATWTTAQAQVSVSIKNKPLKEALTMLEKQSGYRFFYSSTLPGTEQTVSVEANNQPIKQVLDKMLANLNIDYSVKADKQITLSPAAQPSRAVVKQAPRKVSGKITDKRGEVLVGASAYVKNTNSASVVNVDGTYSVTVSNPNDEIQFQYLGYKSQTFKAGTRSQLDVVLEEDAQTMDEVVVVGYGQQKKANLTGSVSAITSEDIASRPISNVSSGLQGLLPGVTVVSPSGQPGLSNTTIRIRGIGTIGNANPLILIDGVEGDIDALNPNDIESVSVLKDAASASIYGARGANGVLLVNTRKLAGNKTPSVTFDGYIGVQTPTRLPEMCNAIEYMTLDNEARKNINTSEAWFQEQFDAVRNGTQPNLYGDTNWVNEVVKKVAIQQSYGASVVGSFGDSGYRLSYRFFDQDGLTAGKTTGETRHNIRYKMDSKIAKIITISSNIGYTVRDIVEPVNSLSNGGGSIYNAMRIAPNVPVRYTDGTWAYGGGNTNPVAVLHDAGHRMTNSSEVSLQEAVKVDILKGWSVSATYNLTNYNALRETLKKTISFTNPDTDVTVKYNDPNSLSNIDFKHTQQTIFVQTDFDFKIGKHQIAGVLGMQQEWYVSKGFEASRNNLTTELDPTLGMGDPKSMSNDANATQWALRSGFGRLTYNYAERYLFETNIRYDLSSRFHRNNRGGWFPSFSVGWRLMEENFMQGARKYVDNIKIRASYGVLGNQYVGSSNYPYMSTLEGFSKDLSLIGGGATTGYVQSILANPKLTWEHIKMFDIGIDINMFSNRLALVFDYYDKSTDRMLLLRNYPGQIGPKPTEENLGSVNNRGWELDFSWRDKAGDFTYGIGFNISDVKNKITDLGDTSPDMSGYQIRRVGDPIDAFYGYVSEGLMSPDDFEIYNQEMKQYDVPKIPVVVGNDYEPGDIKFRDISGPDGVPDGRITPEYDRVVIGSNIPRYTYNIRGNLGWKGIDFSFSLQGVGKADGYLTGSARHAFQDMAGYPQKIHLGRYHITNNPDINADYPRLTYNKDFNQKAFSTYWLEDASYFRLKNIQIGYTLPKKWTSKARIEQCRFYLSADNLFTKSNFFYAYDPETPVSSGGYYPQVKTCVFGISLTFR